MIIAGAIGNAVDRIFYTAEYLNYYDIKAGRYLTGVVDWIDFYGIWGFNFNIADSAVVVAAIMLIVYMIVVDIIDYQKKKNKEPKKSIDNEKVLSKTEQEQKEDFKINKIIFCAIALFLAGCAASTANTSNTALNVCLTQKANAAIQDGSAFTTPVKTLAQNISTTCLRQLALQKAGLSEESVTAATNVLNALKAAQSS